MRVCSSLCLAGLTFAAQAHGQSFTWTGQLNSNWNAGLNWGGQP